MITNNGIATEAAYPYTGNKVTCAYTTSEKGAYITSKNVCVCAYACARAVCVCVCVCVCVRARVRARACARRVAYKCIISGYTGVTTGSESALQTAVVSQPVIVAIDAGQSSFQVTREIIWRSHSFFFFWRRRPPRS